MTYNIKEKEFKRIKQTISPISNKKGEIGYGEGVTFEDKDYHYPYAGKDLPRDRVTFVSREFNFWNRENGDKEYLILYYDTEQKNFIVLEKLDEDFKKIYSEYKNLNFEQACFYASNKVVEKQRNKEEFVRRHEEMMKLNGGNIF